MLWQPDELGIAQAYITGELDVPGGAAELADGLRRVWQHARAHQAGPISLTAEQKLAAAVLAVAARCARPAADRAVLAGETDR